MFGIIWINCLFIVVSQLTGNLTQKRQSGCIHILHVLSPPTPPPSPCKGILDSTPWIPDSRYSIPFFFSVTWIPGSIVSGIPDSKTQDSGLHNQNFHRLRIPQKGALATKVYGDVNENGKKAIGSDWKNNYNARASRFFVRFFAVTARIRRENA